MLRFVKCPAGSIGQTEAEMEWLYYLASKGVNAPFPLRTQNGRLVVKADDNGDTYIACAFSMLPGQRWDKNNPTLWNKEVFYHWGKAVGKMHRVTKEYQPASGTETRAAFSIRSMISENIQTFPSINRFTEDRMAEIEALPKDKDSYGLIHNDLHPGNFLIDGGDICLFDFDGCAYSWYAFDIGNALYIALWHGRNTDAGEDLTNDIIKYFIKGYLEANDLDDFWLSKIPLFMMCCKIALFSFGCNSETLNAGYDEEDQKIQMYNIKNNILFTGCSIEDSLFSKECYRKEAGA